MKKYMFIGIAGFIGAIFRYVLKSIQFSNVQLVFPVNTVVVNVLGCFILAFLSTLTSETIMKSENLKVAICTGFLGALTTFSTLCKDSFILINKGHYIYSIIYIFSSLILGIIAIYIGYRLAVKIENQNVENS